MRVLGVRTHKDRFEWAVVEGDDRSGAAIVSTGKASIPQVAGRGQELAWVRQEVHAVLDRCRPDAAAVDVCEPSVTAPGRCEVDGVVQEALAVRNVATSRLFAATVRSRFKAQRKADLEAAL